MIAAATPASIIVRLDLGFDISCGCYSLLI